MADFSTWMSANILKLNQEKTELIIFNPKYNRRRITEDIRLQVCVAESVKILRLYFETSLTVGKQVNAISKPIIIIFIISVVSGVISQGIRGKPWPMPSSHQGLTMALLSCMASNVHVYKEYKILQLES